MARQETETYVVLDAPLNPNYGGRHIALPINDHDEACAELVMLRERLAAVEVACDEFEAFAERFTTFGPGDEYDYAAICTRLRAALTEGAGDGRSNG